MKKLKIFAVLALSGSILSSCINDLLNTSPYNQIASSTMWTTDYLTDLGMAGLYNALRSGIVTSGGASGRELYQIDRFGIATQGRDNSSMLNGTITSTDGLFSNYWKEMYAGIWRANDAIHNMPVASPSSPEKVARYVAEAKFLRAYFYFRLNQVYKGVPVYLEEVGLDEMNRARNTEAEVWQVIIDDLTDAINEPNLPNKYEAGNSNYGHVTKGAAYALRGKTYLYMKEYEKAVQDFQQVATCGYGLYQGDYKSLFTQANEQSEEMIFSINFIGVQNYGSDTHMFCGSRSSKGSCWNTYLVSPTIVDLYENADGTAFNWDDVIPGYSSKPVDQREVYFLRDTEGIESLYGAEETASIREEVQKRLDALDALYPGTSALYLPSGNEARLKSAYANRDPRLAANVITPYATYLGMLSGVEHEVTIRWPYWNENQPVDDLRTDTTPYLYYLHRKFVYEGDEVVDRYYGHTDFPLIRYADVLLMWAEALAESQGLSTEAISLVNQVRTRAGIAPLNSSPANTVASKEDLIERIRNERRYEFVNEGINYFDEFRWQTLQEMVYFAGSGVRQAWGGVVSAYVWKEGFNYTWAIPNEEMQKNPNITQNAGWGS